MNVSNLNMSRKYLHPLDVIHYLIEPREESTTTTSLVKQFSVFLAGADNISVENRRILKAVTGHVCHLTKDKTVRSDSKDKMILVREKYQNQAAEDVWSSLSQSLSHQEMTSLTLAEHRDNEEHEELEDNEGNDEHEDNDEQSPDGGTSTVNLEAQDDKDDVSSSELEVIEVSKYDIYDRRIDIETERTDTDDDDDDDQEDETPAEKEMVKFDKTRSVKNLADSFDKIAHESCVSLVDHINKIHESRASKSVARPRSVLVDKTISLSSEGKAWFRASMRGDYQTVARLARSSEDLVHVRDPASGYKALHFAAKQGNEDMIKLLVGTYEQDPDVRTRGGYTPLMLAALSRRTRVYDLLINTYHADQSLRDFSGKTSKQFLADKYQRSKVKEDQGLTQ